MIKDKTLKKLVKAIDTKTAPPEGLKEKLAVNVMAMEYEMKPVISRFERFIFESPLRTACIISVPVAGSLWAVMGSNFVKLISSILG